LLLDINNTTFEYFVGTANLHTSVHGLERDLLAYFLNLGGWNSIRQHHRRAGTEAEGKKKKKKKKKKGIVE
jgi:hypothetical protein